MTDLAPHLTAFLRDYLLNERHFSRHTVKSYTECFRLLVLYAAEQTRTRPCALKIEDFTVALLVAFLQINRDNPELGIITAHGTAGKM